MMSERNVGGRRQGFDRPPREPETSTEKILVENV
jgi:hypothetical protein